jgi:hypothetical protein
MNNQNSQKRNQGQASLVFLVSLVIIMACFALLVDGGRYLVMRNRARMMADASAYSGAGVLDMDQAHLGNFVLKQGFSDDTAEVKAVDIFKKNNADSPEYTDYTLDEVRVQGNMIWVTITGRSRPLFGSKWGLNYSTTITASARAAVGISSER